jgi:hypothetical protein
MKLKVRKHNENYKTEIADFKENPAAYNSGREEDSDDDSSDDDSSDDDSSSNSSDSSDDSSDSDDSDSDSDDGKVKAAPKSRLLKVCFSIMHCLFFIVPVHQMQ